MKDVIDQTFRDWELLLVDDGSKDDSGAICDEFAKTDSRIKVIHKENGGLGSARNAGLDAAEGEYVWFYDVDDHADPNLLEYCVKEMDAQQLDLMMFGFRAITPDLNLEDDVHLYECLLEGQQQLCEHYLDDILFVQYGNGFAWNKFYRKSFLDRFGLRFENQRIQQDEVFNLRCYRYLERAYLSPKVLYTYYIYEKGNTRSRFIPDRFDIYKSVRQHFEDLKKFWGLDDKRLDDYLDKRFYDGVMQCFIFNLTHPNCKWTTVQKNAEMNRINSDVLTQQAYTWAEKHNNGFEQRIFRQACQQENLFKIKLYSKLFGILHTIRRKLK